LADAQDFSFNFDYPAFYQLVEFVRDSSWMPGYATPPAGPTDLSALLERPSDFRGRPIMIEGVVGSNTSYQIPRRPDLGTLTQLQLRVASQPLSVTLVVPGDATDIPLDATVRATGYFMMIRQFYGSDGAARQAALLVCPVPTVLAQAPPAPPSRTLDWRWLLGATVLGLAIAWFVLRRAAATQRHDVHTLHSRQPAPMDLSDELTDWADREDARKFPWDSEDSPRR